MTLLEKYTSNMAESMAALERGDLGLARVHLRSAARQGRQLRAQMAESFRRTQDRRPWLDDMGL